MQSRYLTDIRASAALSASELALVKPFDQHHARCRDRPAGDVQQAVKARAAVAGISLNEVERRARWSTGTLSRVLRANMTLASLERIAGALGCPAWELLRDAAAAGPAVHERP